MIKGMEFDYDGDNDDEGGDVQTLGNERIEGHNLVVKAPEISLHAIDGSNSPRTMRVLGNIKGQTTVILIDTSSIHNFLDPTIIPKAQLTPNSMEQIEVKVAKGELMKALGKLEGAEILLQKQPFIIDFFLLSLGIGPWHAMVENTWA